MFNSFVNLDYFGRLRGIVVCLGFFDFVGLSSLQSHLSKGPRLRWIFLLLTLTSTFFLGCSKGPESRELSGEAQGTTYHIKLVFLKGTDDFEGIRHEVERVFKDIDEKLSNYRSDSNISRFNEQKSLLWIEVPEEVAFLTASAQRVNAITQGCFDLTIKPLFDLWGFSKSQNRIPTDQEIKGALAHVGMGRVEVDLPGLKMRKKDPLVQVDLSSVGQGYTVSVLSRMLEDKGLENYLVEVGGEMKVKGRKADGTPWRVAIEKPNPYTREVERILAIHQQTGTAIMTAGTYRHFFEEGGRVYSHILDPRTGRPVTHNLLSVTVLHDDPTMAELWDTALLCVGEIEARRIAEAEGLRALLIYKEEQALHEYMTKAFEETQDLLPEMDTPTRSPDQARP